LVKFIQKLIVLAFRLSRVAGLPMLTRSFCPSKERAWPILPVVKVGPLTRVPLFVPAESLAFPSNFQWATRLVVGASWARIGSNSPERFATNIVPAKTPTARPIASQACHERTRALPTTTTSFLRVLKVSFTKLIGLFLFSSAILILFATLYYLSSDFNKKFFEIILYNPSVSSGIKIYIPPPVSIHVSRVCLTSRIGWRHRNCSERPGILHAKD